MPKVSFNPDDMYQGGGGIGVPECWGEVIGCHAEIVQWQPKKGTNEQQPRLLSCMLQVQPYEDETFAATKGDPATQEMVIEWGRKDDATGELQPLALRPGVAKDAEDPDPADQGEAIGTQGNTLVGSVAVNLNNAFGAFCKSLTTRGFKPAILGRGYFPDLIGLRAHFKHEKQKSKSGKEFENFIVDQPIKQFPYEQAAKTTTKGAAKKPATAAAGAGAAPSAEASHTNGAATADDLNAYTVEVLKLVASEHRGEVMLVEKLANWLGQKQLKDAKLRQKKQFHVAAANLAKTQEWLEANAVDIGIVAGYEPDPQERGKIGAPANGGRFVYFVEA